MHSSRAIEVLHYLVPVTILTSYMSCRLFDINTLKTSDQKEHRARGAETALRVLQFCLAISYVYEVVAAATHVWQEYGVLLPEDDFFHLAFSGLLFAFIGATNTQTWYSFSTISLTAAILEVVIALVSHDAPSRVQFVLRTGRICAFVFSIAIALLALRSHAAPVDEEREPLLGNGTGVNGTTHGLANGTANKKQEADDEDEDDWRHNKFINRRQKERLESSGSMLGYIKGYSLFLPYMVPLGNLYIQLCLLVVIGDLAIERVLNVLEPRQTGIVARELAASYNSGATPLKPILIYLLLRYLDSRASPVNLIKNLAEQRYNGYLDSRLTIASLDHVLRLSMDFHDDVDSGEIMQAVRQGGSLTTLIDTVFLTIFPLMIDFFVAFFYLGHLFGMYASFLVILAGALYIHLDILATAWNVQRRRKMVKLSREASRVSNEALQGWRTVLYFNRASHTSSVYANAVRTNLAAQYAFFDFQYVANLVTSSANQASFALIVLLAAFLISRGKVDVGSFVTLITYWSSVWGPIRNLSFNIKYTTSSLIDAERLLILFQTKPAIEDSPNARPLKEELTSLRFRSVEFAYDERKKILRNVDFVIEGGKNLALVGETGSGKSTILKLLNRFYDVTSGSIELDGQDLREVTLDSLREAIGVVPQESFLFNTTIMKNVQYGRLDATEEEVYEACKAAAIHEKILTFPDGYESKVGARGVKLSGGEQQRIAIARCLLKDPKILLLDEASSAVDSNTEAHIQEALKRLCQGRTTIAIAHRLSTIIHSDLILVLHEGEIVERGTHHELLAMNGRYRVLWNKQVAANLDSTRKDPKSILNE